MLIVVSDSSKKFLRQYRLYIEEYYRHQYQHVLFHLKMTYRHKTPTILHFALDKNKRLLQPFEPETPELTTAPFS